MNKVAEQLRAMAGRTSDLDDHVLLCLAANELDYLEAHNKRMADNLLKIAEQEDYK